MVCLARVRGPRQSRVREPARGAGKSLQTGALLYSACARPSHARCADRVVRRSQFFWRSLRRLSSPDAFAQEKIVIRADFLFYGDNTEFHGPFRDGETIFGAAGRVAGEIWLIRLGRGIRGRICKSAIWFAADVRTGASRHRAPDAHGSLVAGIRHAASAGQLICLSVPILGAPTGCSPRFSARRSHTSVRTKQASHGRLIAQGSIMISGSHGSVSIQLAIASGSTEDCEPIQAQQHPERSAAVACRARRGAAPRPSGAVADSTAGGRGVRAEWLNGRRSRGDARPARRGFSTCPGPRASRSQPRWRRVFRPRCRRSQMHGADTSSSGGDAIS